MYITIYLYTHTYIYIYIYIYVCVCVVQLFSVVQNCEGSVISLIIYNILLLQYDK